MPRSLLIPGLVILHRGPHRRLARHRSCANPAPERAQSNVRRSRQRQHRGARDPSPPHPAGPHDRLDFRPYGRGAAGIAAQSSRRYGGFRRSPGGGSRSRRRPVFRLRRRPVVAAAGGGDRRRAHLHRAGGGGGGPKRHHRGSGAGGSGHRQPRGRRHVARHQPVAQSLRGHRDRVLAARLVRGSFDGACVARSTFHSRRHAVAARIHAGPSRAGARRRDGPEPRNRHQPPAPPHRRPAPPSAPARRWRWRVRSASWVSWRRT